MKRLLGVGVLGAVLIVCSSEAFAQSEAAVLYLMIKPGARAAGAGEAFVATADDAWATYYNPAGLGFQRGKVFGMSHTNWLPAFASDLYHEYFAYAWEQEGWGNLGVSAIYMSYGEQVRTSEIGDVLGTFRSFDTAIGVSYGALLSDRSSAGVTMKILYSRLAPFGAAAEKGSGTGTSYAVDLGFLIKDFLMRGLSLGVALQNMGPSIAYIDVEQADPLPQNLKMGFAYQIFESEYNSLKLSADFSKMLVKKEKDKADPFYKALITSWFDRPLKTEIDEVIENVGFEYWYGSWVSLRAGFFRDTYFNTGEGKPYMTFGAGLKYSMFQFDAAYVPASETPLADNTRFSLTLRF
ncbi:MAG: PorV/PorQ family protein [bacterium]